MAEINQNDHEEICKILEAMETYGGSFVQALAKCYWQADGINKGKLIVAFEDYFLQYKKFIR